jgi:hypothetical protein
MADDTVQPRDTPLRIEDYALIGCRVSIRLRALPRCSVRRNTAVG